jgi:hypothetical protein
MMWNDRGTFPAVAEPNAVDRHPLGPGADAALAADTGPNTFHPVGHELAVE